MLFRYPSRAHAYTSGRRPWFAGMWHVGSWCEDTDIYDARRHVLYRWGYGAPWRVPPLDWPPDVRQNVMLIVAPD